MAFAVSRLEDVHSLPAGRLRFEVQVETPQLILGPDGTSPVARLPHAVPGRISGLHYGTYDYSASLQISAEYQSMEHPVADFAKEVMQLAVAGTGIRLSDGSTNIIPVGDNVEQAWQLHGRLVRRSLERGYYQGWDLHPAQLPSRFAATYAFYRQGLPAAAARLRNYVEQTGGGVMDDPPPHAPWPPLCSAASNVVLSAPMKSWRWPASDFPNSPCWPTRGWPLLPPPPFPKDTP